MLKEEVLMGSLRDNPNLKKRFMLVEGVGTTPTSVEIEDAEYVSQLEFTAGGIRLTADDSVVAATAGDDVTVTGSLASDGSGHQFNLGDSNAALVVGLDDNGSQVSPVSCRHLHLTAAQVQATETWSVWVTVWYRSN